MICIKSKYTRVFKRRYAGFCACVVFFLMLISETLCTEVDVSLSISLSAQTHMWGASTPTQPLPNERDP